jgi:toxin ParE1/3/4
VRIVWNQRARNDLTRLREDIAETAPSRADLVAARILQSIETLEEFPLLGRIGREEETRELVVPRTPYLVAYWIHGDMIEILRIFHGARRWPTHGNS